MKNIPGREIQHTNNHQTRSVWFVDTGHRVVELLLLTDRRILKTPERKTYFFIKNTIFFIPLSEKCRPGPRPLSLTRFPWTFKTVRKKPHGDIF